VDGDCPSRQACLQEHCRNPCTELTPCGTNADCTVQNTLPQRTMVCMCIPGYVGDADVYCQLRKIFLYILLSQSFIWLKYCNYWHTTCEPRCPYLQLIWPYSQLKSLWLLVVHQTASVETRRYAGTGIVSIPASLLTHALPTPSAPSELIRSAATVLQGSQETAFPTVILVSSVCLRLLQTEKIYENITL